MTTPADVPGPTGPATLRELLVVQVAVVVVAVVLVDLVVCDVFGPAPTARVRTAFAAVAGAACALELARRRAWALLPGGYAVGFVLIAGFALRPAATWFFVPTPTLVGLVGEDVWHGWGRLLSVNLPADPLPELMALPVLLSWTAAFVAAAFVVRSAGTLAPVVPIVAAHLVGLLLTARPASGHLGITAAVAVCAGVLVRLRVRHPAPGWPDGPPVTVVAGAHGPTDRATTATVTLTVIAGLVGVGVLAAQTIAAVLPARFDPRTVDPPPVTVAPSVTPLTLVTTQLRRPARPLFRVRVQSPAPVDRVRTAVLDRYDGTTWSSSARFLVAGRVLPADGWDDAGRPAGMSVVLDGWSGPFLPVLGTPTRLDGSTVSGEQVGYDSGTETLVWSGPPLRGASYGVTGLVPTVDDGLRAAAVMVPGPGEQPPPGVPDTLRTIADTTSGGAGPPEERLRRLESLLRSRPYDPYAPPGHSLAALEQLATPTAGGAGSTEQHAAAFALLARLSGFPARVAVGYLLPAPGPDGVQDVTTRDAHAWPEVHFAGYGWVPFEPTDVTRRAPDLPPPPDAAVPPLPPPPVPPPAVPPVLAPPSPTRARTFAFLAVVTVLVVLAGVVLCAAVVVGAKAVRRAVRRRGPADARLHGAWEEALDVLTDRAFTAGREDPFALSPALTPAETARAARAAFGPATRSLTDLAATLTETSFGGRQVEAADAAWAWSGVDTMRRNLDAGPGGRRRVVRATLDPRSLWRQTALRRRAHRSLRRLGLEVR